MYRNVEKNTLFFLQRYYMHLDGTECYLKKDNNLTAIYFKAVDEKNVVKMEASYFVRIEFLCEKIPFTVYI